MLCRTIQPGYSGRLLASFLIGFVLVASPSRAQPAPQFTTMWGVPGAGPGEFNVPTGIALGPNHLVYVAETYNNRIQRFTASGEFVGQWGTPGTGDGQFAAPWGLATDSFGNVYVEDYDNHQVQKFTSDGNFLARWGSWGTGDGQFDHPWDVAVDPTSSFVYVTDRFNHRVQKFTTAGQFVLKWGVPGADYPGQLIQPSGISVGPSGSVYVIDANYRLRKFSPDGVLLQFWGSQGSGPGQFYGQDAVATDASENVFVADDENNRVEQFTSSGAFVRAWGDICRLYVDRGGCVGDGDGQFFGPKGIVVDLEGSVYVVDSGNHRIQKFDELPVAARSTSWGRLKSFYR